MSNYAIPTLTNDQLETAAAAEIGAETRVFYSMSPVRQVAALEMSAAGDGATAAGATLTLEQSYRPDALLSAGEDLQLLAEAPVRSATDVIVVLNALLNGGAIATTSIAVGASTVFTLVGHGHAVGDTITVAGVTGTAGALLNGPRVITAVPSSSTFTVAVDTTAAVVTLSGTATGPARTGTVTATITAPTWSQDQSANMPQGIAVDFMPSVSGATVRSLVSVASVAGCAAGSKFAIVSMPSASSYTEVAGVTAKSYDPPSPKSVSIPDGYDSARWVKRGREIEHKLEIKSVSQGGAEGLARLNGHSVTVKLERKAQGAVLTQRDVFGGYLPTISVTKGDGETVAEVSATGMYAFYGCFC